MPILAKITSTITALPHGQPGSLSAEVASALAGMELPFSWVAFYFAAVCAALANLIYVLFCPSLARSFNTFSDFQGTGRGCEQLRREVERLLLRHHGHFGPAGCARNLEEFSTQFCEKPLDPDSVRKIEVDSGAASVAASELKVRDSRLGEAFWAVRELVERVSPVWRLACFVLYAVAFALIGYVFIENVLFVARTIFRP